MRHSGVGGGVRAFALRPLRYRASAQGITAATLPHYFAPSIDVVSMGSLTHGYEVVDFSLKIQKGDGVKAVARAAEKAAAKASGAGGAPSAGGGSDDA